jgi:hypothetical protein
MNPADINEFWDDLLAHIEERRVIPVLGPELLTITEQGREVRLYRALAERLLEKYELGSTSESVEGQAADDEVVLRPHQELNDAVCALAQRGKRIQELYRPINDLLRSILGARPTIPEALRQLAQIRDFDLFVTTTCDDLLARALDEVRGAGAPICQQIVYAPNLPGNQARDIPEIRSSSYCAVFHLFGRASASPFYAIHDEDTLEFLYNLQAGHGNLPERMLSEVRSRNLLIIGCTFADWLNRFFIRLSNQVRLSGDRTKKEFLVGNEVTRDSSLTLFLERFSQNTRVYPGDAGTFIGELTRRWHERHPEVAGVMPPGIEPEQAPGAGEIFISYSRTDLPAARALFADIEKIGAGVIWFDKSILEPGDEWERTIMGALKRCALFLALISSSTEERPEGYFRREWYEAAERSKMIQGRRFIFPVVVDPEFDGNASRYRLVPDVFSKFQLDHAPMGRMSDKLRQAIIDALRDLRRRRSS